jgi:hypothetical protein
LAILGALYTTTKWSKRRGGTSFGLDLAGLGAETGEIVFSDPAVDPRPWDEPEGYFLAEGKLHLRILRTVQS